MLLTGDDWTASPEAVEFIKVDWEMAEEYPLLLVPGRVLLQSEQDVEIEEGRQNRIVREELVSVSEGDAESLGLEEGDLVAVVMADSRMEARVRDCRRGGA